MTVKKDVEQKQEIPVIEAAGASSAPRGGVGMKTHLVLRTGKDEPKLEWHLKTNTAVEAVHKVRELCKEHGKKYPADVLTQDFIR